jgi:heme-degrading monooxygenase HmoA
MQKTEYVKGVYVKKGKYGTKVSFKLDAFIEEIKSKKNKDGFVNIEIKEAKSGEKLYAVYDTWEPKGDYQSGKSSKPTYQQKSAPVSSNDDLPF